MKSLKNFQSITMSIVLMSTIAFSLYAFTPDYNLTQYPVGEEWLSNTSPPDTVIIMDPVTYEQTMYVVVNDVPVEDFMVKNYPGTVTFSDTIIVLDPVTYKEKVEVKSGKIKKAYQMMIDYESNKKEPNLDLINKWRQIGIVNE